MPCSFHQALFNLPLLQATAVGSCVHRFYYSPVAFLPSPFLCLIEYLSRGWIADKLLFKRVSIDEKWRMIAQGFMRQL